jgi:RNA polymerase sigma factor (TIGR02999 family)
VGSASPPDITQWLQAWSRGDPSALEKLAPLVYAELHRRARFFMGRERAGHSLQPTALIHEAYLRLVGSKPVEWEDRRHFYALSSRLMRQILVQHARAHRARKRGGGAVAVAFDEEWMGGRPAPDLARLDEALGALAQMDERKSHVVELRFFGGFSAEATAEILGVSPQTVLRDWRLAKAWLQREMKRGGGDAGRALERA